MQGGGAAGGLCRRFALLGCFLLSVLHTEPAVESNAVLIGYIDNARSLVVNEEAEARSIRERLRQKQQQQAQQNKKKSRDSWER